MVREQVTRFSATDIQLETPKVRKLIEEKLRARFKDTPVSIQSVDVGQIQFPDRGGDAISRKIARSRSSSARSTCWPRAARRPPIRVLEALKLAKQQRIISSTLDPLYVQQRAVPGLPLARPRQQQDHHRAADQPRGHRPAPRAEPTASARS